MWDFGRADSIEPEAIGEPGDRRFRIRVMARLESASLWLEKEQVAALALALRRLLEQTKRAEEPAEPEPVMGGSFPEMPDVDFRPSRLGIGHDDQATNISIFAYDPEAGDDENATPTFSCQVSRGQARAFARRAEEIVNAGRPVCVLCGIPLDEDGHKCLRRNGHAGLSASSG
ncbi:MAG: DUF3090 family protein [Chloroflexi bacterium]|nr:DUF3090 family protein [Chloroflexota bacterium]